MKFFGQSVHGEMDLNNDGLIDVTIGGLGGAALFWYGYLRATVRPENNHLPLDIDVTGMCCCLGCCESPRNKYKT